MDRKLNSYILLEPTDKTEDFLRDFLEILSPKGKANLAVDILGCSTDENLRQLVQSIRTGLLIPLKAQGGKTPTEITPSPHFGLEDSIENFKSLNIEPITRSPQSQLRSHCLERDGHKCLATGLYSYTHAHPQGEMTTYLEAAHIIPFALESSQAKDRRAEHRNASIWVNLWRYFPVLRNMSFTSEQINLEKKVLMLDSQLRKEFSQFRVIFVATGVAHQYRIKTFSYTITGSIQF